MRVDDQVGYPWFQHSHHLQKVVDSCVRVVNSKGLFCSKNWCQMLVFVTNKNIFGK